MSIPKRQHWVPRFYLRYFTVPNQTGNQELVWIFHRKKGEPQLTNIQNIAVEKYLYSSKKEDGTRDVRLEKKLAKLEGTLSKLWPQLATGFVDLGADSIRKGIALYLAVQFLRHPERRDSFKEMRRRLIEAIERGPMNENGVPSIDTVQIGQEAIPFNPSEWESLREEGTAVAQEIWHEFIEQEAITYARLLMKKRWSVVFLKEPLFITSDYPLFVVDQSLERFQVAQKGAIIMFPLSPTRILCFDDLDAPENQYYLLDNKEADTYNLLIWVNTESFMISSRDIYHVLEGIVRVRNEFDQQ